MRNLDRPKTRTPSPHGQLAVLLRFCAVGIVTAGIYAAILGLIVEVAQQRPTIGVAIAYILAVIFNYWAHRVWTYKSDRPHRSAGSRYIILIGVVFCVDVSATALLPNFLGVNYAVVQIGLAVIIAGVTFVGLGRWVFSSPRATAQSTRQEPVMGETKY